MRVLENIPTFTLVVALALRDENARWLMHKRPEGKAHAGLWEFPGGKVEANESPENALVREIREELGIELDPVRLRPAGFAQSASIGGATQIVILLYSCENWEGAPRSLEGGEIAWFEAGEMALLERPPLDIALCRSLLIASRVAGEMGDCQSG